MVSVTFLPVFLIGVNNPERRGTKYVEEHFSDAIFYND